MNSLEQRNALFSAALRDRNIDYAAKGFHLNETEDLIELRQNGVLVDRFSWQVPTEAIRNSCRCWLIKNGDFSYEATKQCVD